MYARVGLPGYGEASPWWAGAATVTVSSMDTGTDPLYRLAFEDDRLVITGTVDGERLPRRAGGARRETITGIVAGHRRALADGEPDAGAPWSVGPTEVLLHQTYELVTRPLLELIDGRPRIGLDLVGRLLNRLPVETAHRPDTAALFELTQCYRVPAGPGPGAPGAAGGRQGRFRLRTGPADTDGLHAVALEQSLVSAVHRGGDRSDRHPVPLVVVAGHRPTIPDGLGPDAHVVLNGCDSLPPVLPPGVASVVGTLWPVADRHSVTLSAAYHGRLAAGVGPLEALRQAQLLHRWQPVEIWAPYVYLGWPL